MANKIPGMLISLVLGFVIVLLIGTSWLQAQLDYDIIPNASSPWSNTTFVNKLSNMSEIYETINKSQGNLEQGSFIEDVDTGFNPTSVFTNFFTVETVMSMITLSFNSLFAAVGIPLIVAGGIIVIYGIVWVMEIMGFLRGKDP